MNLNIWNFCFKANFWIFPRFVDVVKVASADFPFPFYVQIDKMVSFLSPLIILEYLPDPYIFGLQRPSIWRPIMFSGQQNLKFCENDIESVNLTLIYFYRPNAPRRSESLASMEPVMVLPSVKPSRRWKSHSTLSTTVISAER